MPCPEPSPKRLSNAIANDSFEAPLWSDRLRVRMSWIPSLGRDPSKSVMDSTVVIRAGLDDSAQVLDRWTTLSLVRLHGEMGWTCKGCGGLLNDPKSRIGFDVSCSERLVQARTPSGSLVAWMTLDTVSGKSFHYFIDREFVRRDDSASVAFDAFIRKTSRDQARKRDAGAVPPKRGAHLLREVDRMGQFSHFSSLVADLDIEDRLGRIDSVSQDSVRFSRLARKAATRRILPEELDALGLAANIGITSRSCYGRVTNGEITFRTRRKGTWRVTSAWNAQGKPVAWNALDTASDFPFPLWFHLDRDACRE